MVLYFFLQTLQVPPSFEQCLQYLQFLQAVQVPVDEQVPQQLLATLSWYAKTLIAPMPKATIAILIFFFILLFFIIG